MTTGQIVALLVFLPVLASWYAVAWAILVERQAAAEWAFLDALARLRPAACLPGRRAPQTTIDE